jgi:BlaR1 peptidase M56
MDRELVLVAAVALACGPAIALSAWRRPRPGPRDGTGEGALWRETFRPLLPASLLVAGLLGWALVEPEPSDERIPLLALLVIVPFGFVCGRALWRGTRSALRLGEAGPAATVGLLRPRVVLSPAFRQSVDPEALLAALEHERAHVRHRDPLRVWLAQLATDLQWPWPSAPLRFEDWREALELARDEEARRRGVDGAALASAIIAAVRLEPSVAGGCARLGSDPRRLERRILRLLDPLPTPAPTARSTPRLMLLPGALLAVFVFGSVWGDVILHRVLVGSWP